MVQSFADLPGAQATGSAGEIPSLALRAGACSRKPRQGFVAVLSASYFPDAQIVLHWVREESGGNVFRWDEKGMESWLCPI